MTWRGSYYTEVTLDCFLPELWPFVSFCHLSTEVLVSASPPIFLKGYWWTFPVIVSMTWRWSYFIEVMLNWFLPELRSLCNFLTVSLVSATPLAVFSRFLKETFRLFSASPLALHRSFPHLGLSLTGRLEIHEMHCSTCRGSFSPELPCFNYAIISQYNYSF